MKHQPITLLLLCLFAIAPFIGNAQDILVVPERNHITSITLTSYSNEFNSADAGYAYRVLRRNSFNLHAGLTSGVFYPRIKLSTLSSEDLIVFVAPNVELAFGRKHIFYVAFWRNFMKDDEAPYKSAVGYRHVFASKQMALKAFGSFLWTRDVSQFETDRIFTNGGIGFSLERHF